MLERLNQMGWEQLRESNVPMWLRALSSEDRITRNAAFKELEHFLVPWEALELCAYESEQILELAGREVIARTVPFIIDLLAFEMTQDKELLLLLLNELLGYEDGEKCLEEA